MNAVALFEVSFFQAPQGGQAEQGVFNGPGWALNYLESPSQSQAHRVVAIEDTDELFSRSIWLGAGVFRWLGRDAQAHASVRRSFNSFSLVAFDSIVESYARRHAELFLLNTAAYRQRCTFIDWLVEVRGHVTP